MERARLLEHLAHAEGHALMGERDIARQRAVIAQLQRDGHDTSAARKLLATFESVQAMHLADLERLRRAIAQAP